MTARTADAFALLVELRNRAFARRREQRKEHLRLVRVLPADVKAEAGAPDGLLRSVFDGVPASVLIAESNGRLVDANNSALALLGYARRALLNLSLADLIPASADWVNREFARLAERKEWRGAVELRRGDASLLPAELYGGFIDTSAGSKLMLAVQDVSERRASVQRHHEALDAAEHRVLDALTPVVGLTHVLLKANSFDREIVQEVLGMARRLELNVRELIEAARGSVDAADSGAPKLDIADLLEAAVEDAQRATTIHRISLFTPRGALQCGWEPGMIRRVILSLLHHAISDSPAGGPVLVTATDSGTDVLVSVSDHGLGIAPEEIANVFARLERPAARLASAAGRGLGLHLLRELVELQGGQLWVESEGRGRGSTFSFTLPSQSTHAFD